MIDQSFIDELFSIKGKVAVVAGGSRGIGFEIANAFGLCGAQVIALGRSERALNEDSLTYYRCDIGNYPSLNATLKKIQDKFGRIDILVNAAGVTLDQQSNLSAYEVFKETLNINLFATYNSCILAGNIMALNGCGGSIINITSIAAFQGFPANPAYVSSKGAVASMTKALALDFADVGVRVNCIAPGYILTAMTEGSYLDKKKHAERLEHMMIKRWGKVSDLVGAAIYLASNASAYVTGTDLVVDGGWIAKGM